MTASLSLVTGASSGIGAAVARELARRGSAVILVARTDESVHAVVSAVGPTAEVVIADLSRDVDIARVEAVIAERRPNLVVNCAATGRHAPLEEQTVPELDATVAVNVLAPLRLTAAAVRAGAAGVINVSTTASDAHVPRLAPYVASKAFLESLSLSVSSPVAAGGSPTLATVVRPGFTRTAFHDRLGEDVSRVPDGAWLSAQDVARRALDAHDAGFRRVTIDVPVTTTQWVRRAVGRFLRQVHAGRERRR